MHEKTKKIIIYCIIGVIIIGILIIGFILNKNKNNISDPLDTSSILEPSDSTESLYTNQTNIPEDLNQQTDNTENKPTESINIEPKNHSTKELLEIEEQLRKQTLSISLGIDGKSEIEKDGNVYMLSHITSGSIVKIVDDIFYIYDYNQEKWIKINQDFGNQEILTMKDIKSIFKDLNKKEAEIYSSIDSFDKPEYVKKFELNINKLSENILDSFLDYLIIYFDDSNYICLINQYKKDKFIIISFDNGENFRLTNATADNFVELSKEFSSITAVRSNSEVLQPIPDQTSPWEYEYEPRFTDDEENND